MPGSLRCEWLNVDEWNGCDSEETIGRAITHYVSMPRVDRTWPAPSKVELESPTRLAHRTLDGQPLGTAIHGEKMGAAPKKNNAMRTIFILGRPAT